MRALALGLLLVLLGGCAALGRQADQPQRIDEMLSGVLRDVHGTPAARRSALEHARRAFTAGGGDYARLRLATLLATLPAPLGDDSRAAMLLKPLEARQPETPFSRFASLLAGQLAERRGFEERMQRRERGLFSALHRLLAALQSRQKTVLQSEQRANDLQQKADELQKKLDALEAIERQSLDREQQLQ